MADEGWSYAHPRSFKSDGPTPDALGKAYVNSLGYFGAKGNHTATKAPVSVDVTITGATANSVIALTRNGVYVSPARANGSGVAHFYDLDDSDDHLYYAYQIGSTNLWSVSVENQTVVVTPLSFSSATHAHAFICG